MGALKAIDIVKQNHDLQSTKLAKSPGGEFLGPDQIDMDAQIKRFMAKFPRVSTVELAHYLPCQAILVRILGAKPIPDFAEMLEGAIQISQWNQAVLIETDTAVDVWTFKESALHQQIVERIAELLP